LIILKDKPLPKIFIRATTDPKTKRTVREIVDGQQRMRAILSFVKDGFKISKIHNEEYGGMTYSELPEDVQADFLKYEISVDLLLDLSDRDVLDIFARLNTYSVSLNKQELFNAKYFGYFKQLVYKLSGDYYTFWTENKIFTESSKFKKESTNYSHHSFRSNSIFRRCRINNIHKREKEWYIVKKNS
jgi:hypothetical protein